MVENSPKRPWDAYEDALAKTQARRADLRAEFEKKDDELRAVEEKLVRTIEDQKDLLASMESLGDDMVETMQSLVASQGTSEPSPDLDSRFYKKSLPDCAAIVIREAGRPLTEQEIVDALRSGGVQIVSKMPQMNVRRSMARRSDVFEYKNRKWEVVASPVDDGNSPLNRTVDNFNTVHAESTRKGIAAAQARGVPFGRTPVITPEKEKTLLALRSQGLQAKEISKTLEISRTSYFNYLKEHGLSKKYEFSDAEESEKSRLI